MTKIKFVVANASERACMPPCYLGRGRKKGPSRSLVLKLIKSNPDLAESLQGHVILCQYLGMYTGPIYAAVYGSVEHFGSIGLGWILQEKSFLMNNKEAISEIESGKYLVAKYVEESDKASQENKGAA